MKMNSPSSRRRVSLYYGLLMALVPVLSNAASSAKILDKARPTVVTFLSMHCPNSIAHLNSLAELAKRFPGFYFVGVHSNVDESTEAAGKFFRQSPLPFRVIEDSKGALAKELKAFKTPHAFVIGADGKVLYGGGLTNSAKPETATKLFLAEALEDVQASRKVRTPEGRTLGCIIALPEEGSKEGASIWSLKKDASKNVSKEELNSEKKNVQ